MAFNQVQNRDIVNNIINDLGLNPGPDVLPTTVNTTIQPIYQIYEKTANIVRSVTVTNATSGTAYTTPTDKDFYLTGAALSIIKDASSTSVSSAINITVNGSGAAVLSIPSITLTAQQSNISLSINPPIKIDRSTNITVTNSTNVANIIARGSIMGFVKNNRTNEAA